MRHVLGLVTAGQMLGGCPLAGPCSPAAVSLRLLLGAALPRHEPLPACGEKCRSFVFYFSVLSIMRNDIFNLIRFCSQRNWI